MTLDNKCQHNILRYDGIQPDTEALGIAQWTCTHPSQVGCGMTVYGRAWEQGRRVIGFVKINEERRTYWRRT